MKQREEKSKGNQAFHENQSSKLEWLWEFIQKKKSFLGLGSPWDGEERI